MADFHDSELGRLQFLPPDMWQGTLSIEQNYKGSREQMSFRFVIHGDDEQPNPRLVPFVKKVVPSLDDYRLRASEYLVANLRNGGSIPLDREFHMPSVAFFFEEGAGVIVVCLDGYYFRGDVQEETPSVVRALVEFCPSESPLPRDPCMERYGKLFG